VDQGLVNGEFCLALKVARLQMFAHSEKAPICSLNSSLYFQTHDICWCHQAIRDPRYTNSLTTSKCLSPITTLCPTSRIVLSFRAAIIYFVFCSFIFNPTLAASLPIIKHSERLTDSYRRFRFHRHMRVVVFLCCRLCRLFIGLCVVR
jgi:hypothetical protein